MILTVDSHGMTVALPALGACARARGHLRLLVLAVVLVLWFLGFLALAAAHPRLALGKRALLALLVQCVVKVAQLFLERRYLCAQLLFLDAHNLLEAIEVLGGHGIGRAQRRVLQ